MAGRKLHVFRGAIHAFEPAQAKPEMIPERLCQRLDLLGVGVEVAGRQLVQQGLPDVGAGYIDQCDLRSTLFAQGARQAALPARGRQPCRRQ